VEGQQFTIVESSVFHGSLFRAVSNAVTDSEKSFDKVRKRIISEIEQNWMDFMTDLGDYCGYSLLQVPSLTRPGFLMSQFKNRFMTSMTGTPAFFLKAAGMAFHFRYVLIDANDYNGSTVVSHSENRIAQNWDTVFYFLRTGTLPETWFYQYLVPIGSVNKQHYYVITII
jgi:hypothetical protein